MNKKKKVRVVGPHNKQATGELMASNDDGNIHVTKPPKKHKKTCLTNAGHGNEGSKQLTSLDTPDMKEKKKKKKKCRDVDVTDESLTDINVDKECNSCEVADLPSYKLKKSKKDKNVEVPLASVSNSEVENECSSNEAEVSKKKKKKSNDREVVEESVNDVDVEKEYNCNKVEGLTPHKSKKKKKHKKKYLDTMESTVWEHNSSADAQSPSCGKCEGTEEGLMLGKKKKKKSGESAVLAKPASDEDIQSLSCLKETKKTKKKKKKRGESTVLATPASDEDIQSLSHLKETKKTKKKKVDTVESSDGCIDSAASLIDSSEQIKPRPKRKHRLESSDAVDVVCKKLKTTPKLIEVSRNRGEHDDSTNQVRKLKKKKKKRKKSEDEDSVLWPVGSVDENCSVKKEKKMKYNESEEEAEQDNISDLKKSNKMPKTESSETILMNKQYNKSTSPHNTYANANLGQWRTATFEDNSKQNKFFRLLGGFKKSTDSASSGVESPKAGLFKGLSLAGASGNLALSASQISNRNSNIEAEFVKAQSIHFGKRSGGLGFTPPPGEGKKFHIDTIVTKSVKFD